MRVGRLVSREGEIFDTEICPRRVTTLTIIFLTCRLFFQGEKAYSCQQCGTRFTYRNGLIKHTKLNRCPKKIVTAEGETIIKKRSRAAAAPASSSAAAKHVKASSDSLKVRVLQYH